MISLTMIVLDKFRDRPSEVPFTERNHPIETFLFDRAHEALRVGVGIRRLERRLYNVDTSLRQQLSELATPLSVAVTDQHAMIPQQSVLGPRERATDLAHEQLVRMRCGSHDLDAT